MTEIEHDHLISEIKNLNLADQLRLLEEVAALIRQKTVRLNRNRSIMELKGKGKNIWKDLNVEDYLNEERSSWTG
ncbi:MAG: hypothetical protein ACLFNW_12775 [Desulfobacterales bacterium]